MKRTLTPVRGFWLGIVLILLGLAVGLLLIPAMFASGGQALAWSEVVRFVGAFFGGVVLPLGLTFVALSLVGRALEPTSRSVISAADPGEGVEDAPSWPPRVSSRFALATGIVLVVIGIISQLHLFEWTQAIQADATFIRARVGIALQDETRCGGCRPYDRRYGTPVSGRAAAVQDRAHLGVGADPAVV